MGKTELGDQTSVYFRPEDKILVIERLDAIIAFDQVTFEKLCDFVSNLEVFQPLTQGEDR